MLVLLDGLFCSRGVDAWVGVGGIDGVGLSSGTSGSFDNTLNWFEVLNTIEKQNVTIIWAATGKTIPCYCGVIYMLLV